MTPPTPIPLDKLPAKWRERYGDALLTPTGEAVKEQLAICADELEAALRSQAVAVKAADALLDEASRIVVAYYPITGGEVADKIMALKGRYALAAPDEKLREALRRMETFVNAVANAYEYRSEDCGRVIDADYKEEAKEIQSALGALAAPGKQETP